MNAQQEMEAEMNRRAVIRAEVAKLIGWRAVEIECNDRMGWDLVNDGKSAMLCCRTENDAWSNVPSYDYELRDVVTLYQAKNDSFTIEFKPWGAYHISVRPGLERKVYTFRDIARALYDMWIEEHAAHLLTKSTPD